MQLKEVPAMESYIEDIATKKLKSDLDLSICHTPETAENARAEAKRRIRVAEPYSKLDLCSQYVDNELTRRIAAETDSSTLAETNDVLYKRLELLRKRYDSIYVNCECIEPAAVVVLAFLRDRYALPIKIFSEDYSGRQQVLRISNNSDPHLLITANAAFNFGAHDYAKHYNMVMELHWEFQGLLVFKRENKNEGLVYVYDSSSATEQYEIHKDLLKSMKKQIRLYESIGSLVEELDCDRLRPGDYIIAWEPLLTGLLNRSKGRLRRVRQSQFRHLISIYAREDIVRDESDCLENMLSAFRYVWKACIDDPPHAERMLLKQKNVLAQMAIGAGLGNASA